MNINVDPQEIHKFSALAHRWWDPGGDFRTLHDINPIRLDWIDRHAGLMQTSVLDVGCGGGILSESMAKRGAEVLGIDLAIKPLRVAQLHAMESGLPKLRYQEIAAEALAAQVPGSFDVVTCMEMLEHVPEPASVIRACAQLVKPGGHVFFSTLNRNPKAYLLAIIGAEYVLGMLPKGTHDYARFIRPSELAQAARQAGLEPLELKGLQYNPFTRRFKIAPDISVSYMMACQRSR